MKLPQHHACAAGILSLITLLICSMANGIEEPAYDVLAQFDDIEVRRYVATVQAVTAMPPTGGTGSGFRRLAGYIFGGNSNQEKIAMTAPVATTITADEPEMAFTMPAEWSLGALPAPEDEAVMLREVPAFVAAVVTFSGRATEKRSRAMLERLQEQLVQRQINTTGGPILNQYNPPWTLPFLRRNEIMIRINWQQATEQPLAATTGSKPIDVLR
jgi:hypothetical protein